MVCLPSVRDGIQIAGLSEYPQNLDKKNSHSQSHRFLFLSGRRFFIFGVPYRRIHLQPSSFSP